MKKKKSIPTPVPTTAPCHVCSNEMIYLATIPPAARLPALYSFKCSSCGCRRTELHEGRQAEDTAA